jgi:NitT/TauT family transport system ATP-binding protein
MADIPLLEMDHATLRHGSSRRGPVAVDDVSFTVNRGDRLMLLGPSGSGKSTILQAIGGYLRPISGTVRINGKPIKNPAPDRLTVFQEFDQLMPWKTVRKNVTYPLRACGRLSKSDALRRADEFIRKVRLERFADSFPHQLSGGMKQRVAIARCLAMKPAVVLMDEPFAALDALTRRQMQEELLALWKDSPFTMIFVTHSIIEAMLVGSRVILLSPHPGRVAGTWEVPQDGDTEAVRNEIERELFGIAGGKDMDE